MPGQFHLQHVGYVYSRRIFPGWRGERVQCKHPRLRFDHRSFMEITAIHPLYVKQSLSGTRLEASQHVNHLKKGLLPYHLYVRLVLAHLSLFCPGVK